MKAYEAYKDSGVEWLGRVPEGWDIVSSRRLFQQTRDAAFEGDEQLSATQKSGVIPQRLFMEQEDQKVVLALAGTGNFKHVEAGDFVISLRSFQGGIEYSAHTGCVSPAYTVLRRNSELEDGYFAYLLKSGSYVSKLQSITTGIRDGRNISYEQFAVVALPFPPLSEQRTIASFLNREVGKIDDLIAEQQRLIALLAEKRQATISHAVTKGLNPNARLKPSGIDWLGDVPEGWEVAPLKYLVAFQSGGTPSKDNLDYWDGEIPWASAKDLKVEKLADTQLHITDAAVSSGGASLIPSGSVVVLVRGMTLAKAFPVCLTTVPLAINQDLKAVISGPRIASDFLAHVLRGLAAESLSRIDEAGHGTKALRMDAWTSMELPLPPMVEQVEIAHAIDAAISKIDTLARAASDTVSLLQERRSALISAAVTGKIDVRETIAAPARRMPAQDVSALVLGAVIANHLRQDGFGRMMTQKYLFLAQTNAKVEEIGGSFIREAAGPYDADLQARAEKALESAGLVRVEQEGGWGSRVEYEFLGDADALRADLATVLGDRMKRFNYLFKRLGRLNKKEIEAVATLYAAWNDFLIDGHLPGQDEIIREVLENWHEEKPKKFTADELKNWLGWMGRQDIVPDGTGPRTLQGRLFV